MLRIDDEVKPEFVKVFAEHFKKYPPEVLGKEFFKKINKNEFNHLLNNQEAFLKDLKKHEKNRRFNCLRKKFLSIHFRNGAFNLTVCGKEII